MTRVQLFYYLLTWDKQAMKRRLRKIDRYSQANRASRYRVTFQQANNLLGRKLFHLKLDFSLQNHLNLFTSVIRSSLSFQSSVSTTHSFRNPHTASYPHRR